MANEAPRGTISFDGLGLKLDSAQDAEKICETMANKNINVLILRGNTFGIEAAQRIGEELANHSNLREAHFKDIMTSRGKEEAPVAMGHLLHGIVKSGARLKLLDLSDNAVGPIGAPALIKFLESPSADLIERLYLNNCGLGPEGSTSISVCLPRLKNLREFVCGRNRLENKGAKNMSKALSQLHNLEVLKLPQNGIFVEGIKQLVDALESNLKHIREIDLSDNTIKAEGADALDSVLSRASSLRVLRLDDALLENKGFSIICDALFRSHSLARMKVASFEGNELHGQKVVDLINFTFVDCRGDFCLNLMENEFTRAELMQLDDLGKNFQININDPEECDSEYEDEDADDGSDYCPDGYDHGCGDQNGHGDDSDDDD